MVLLIFHHGRLQLVDAAADAFSGNIIEKGLDEISPERRRWREAQLKPWMLLQPVLHVGMFVFGIDVSDHMHGQVFACLSVAYPQEAQKLVTASGLGRHSPMTVPLWALRAANKFVVP